MEIINMKLKQVSPLFNIIKRIKKSLCENAVAKVRNRDDNVVEPVLLVDRYAEES